MEEKASVIENTDSFPCPSCGGEMAFNVDTQSLKCPYCENEIKVEEDSDAIIKEYDFESVEEKASKDWGNETRAIKCDSCGAETILDTHTTASFCSFCGSSHIVTSEESSTIAPESLVPFKITKEKAKELFNLWVKKRWFKPIKFREKINIDKLNGTYIPYWTYDFDTTSFYTGQRGTYYYVTERRTVNGEERMVQVRKTRWQHVTGVYNSSFDDILVHGTKNVDQKLIKKIEPFHLNELVPYSPEYLSGFQAERYSIDLKEGWEFAKDNIENKIRSGIRRQIGGDEARVSSVRTTYSNEKFKHFLLPIWMSSYKYKDKLYRFIINGQTGEVQGRAPRSVKKILLYVGIFILVTGILSTLSK